MTDLYEKVVSPGGRVSYKRHEPPDNRMFEIPTPQMITLLTTLTVSMLQSVEAQLPPHARVAREVKGVEQAVVRLARLNAEPLDERLVEAGVAAWNAAIHAMQENLGGGEER